MRYQLQLFLIGHQGPQIFLTIWTLTKKSLEDKNFGTVAYSIKTTNYRKTLQTQIQTSRQKFSISKKNTGFK